MNEDALLGGGQFSEHRRRAQKEAGRFGEVGERASTWLNDVDKALLMRHNVIHSISAASNDLETFDRVFLNRRRGATTPWDPAALGGIQALMDSLFDQAEHLWLELDRTPPSVIRVVE